MVEKVARAIYDSTYKALSQEERDADWEDMKATFIPDARAAIEAMREPTEEMKAACMAPRIGSPMESYVAMIDAALGIQNPRNQNDY